MFEIKSDTQRSFDEYEIELKSKGRQLGRMTPEDFARIEGLWQHPLPEAYKTFMETYGPVPFPDVGQSSTSYVYKEGDFEQSFACQFTGFVDFETLALNHRYLLDDTDNDTGGPFFPTNMLSFGGDPGQNKFLLELGTDTPRVWFWEDQPDAWGSGNNTRLGLVADNLVTFINTLA